MLAENNVMLKSTQDGIFENVESNEFKALKMWNSNNIFIFSFLILEINSGRDLRFPLGH